MSLRAITITHADTAWHAAFDEYVARVFPRVGFRRWRELGGWDERYRAFALADGERIVANASLFQMDLVLRGEHVRGWQLGAVGTLPEHRRRGLQAQLMPRLFEQTTSGDLVFLFANDDVLEFYPRFGFRRVRETLFRADCHVAPNDAKLRTLDIDDADDRALLQRIAATARPITELFGARDYGSIVLWYWTNFFARGLRYDAEHDAIVVVDQRGERLHVHDVLCAKPYDLRVSLPRFIDAPITELEFGFAPERIWPDARHAGEQAELFVRGPHALPETPFKYPMLAQT